MTDTDFYLVLIYLCVNVIIVNTFDVFKKLNWIDERTLIFSSELQFSLLYVIQSWYF